MRRRLQVRFAVSLSAESAVVMRFLSSSFVGLGSEGFFFCFASSPSDFGFFSFAFFFRRFFLFLCWQQREAERADRKLHAQLVAELHQRAHTQKADQNKNEQDDANYLQRSQSTTSLFLRFTRF